MADENVNNNLIIENHDDLQDFNMNFLRVIPEYDGTQSNLGDFISACDLIMDNYYDDQMPNAFRNKLLLISVKNKLKGTAKQLIATRNLATWADIRNCLFTNFADQRDTESLLRDLHHIHQKTSETPKQFGQRIIEHMVLLHQSILRDDDPPLVSISKKESVNIQGLKTFLAGLHEPLGSNIRARKPETIQQALQFILEEENITYMRSRLGQSTSKNVNYNKAQYPSATYEKFCSICKKSNHDRQNCRYRQSQQPPIRNPATNNFRVMHAQNSYNPGFQQPTFSKPQNFNGAGFGLQNFARPMSNHNPGIGNRDPQFFQRNNQNFAKKPQSYSQPHRPVYSVPSQFNRQVQSERRPHHNVDLLENQALASSSCYEQYGDNFYQNNPETFNPYSENDLTENFDSLNLQNEVAAGHAISSQSQMSDTSIN